jgi:peptide-methionine (S)-S-oxide reductase
VAHDPTTLNRQHNDVGTQYRSSVFYADEEQKKTAEAYIAELNQRHVFRDPIVTKVVPLEGFFAAEDYHQHFLDKNPTHPYIVHMDLPLIEALKQQYPDLYKR